MSKMVELVARALYECPGSDLIAKLDHNFPAKTWEQLDPRIKDDFLVKARAALAAMREPTEAMMGAGDEATYEPGDDLQYVGKTILESAWRAMINEALES